MRQMRLRFAHEYNHSHHNGTNPFHKRHRPIPAAPRAVVVVCVCIFAFRLNFLGLRVQAHVL